MPAPTTASPDNAPDRKAYYLLSLAMYWALLVGIASSVVRSPVGARCGCAAAPVRCAARMLPIPTAAELQALLDGPARAPSGKVRKALAKPQGVLTIIGGYSPAWEAISFAKGEMNARELDNVEYVGRQFRLGGAIAVAPVMASGELAGGVAGGGAGCSVAQLRQLVEEQQRAKGDFPGPCPILLDGPLSSPHHLAQAAAAGCAGVCLDADALGPGAVRARERHARPADGWTPCGARRSSPKSARPAPPPPPPPPPPRPPQPPPHPPHTRPCDPYRARPDAASPRATLQAAELYGVAQHLGLEVIAYAAPSAESIAAASALSSGVGIVCVRTVESRDATQAVGAFPPGVIRLASCTVADVREAWSLRDAGYNGLLLANCLLMQATIERVEVQTVLKAIRAKGSARYGKGSSLGRGEGAKEILGTIAI